MSTLAAARADNFYYPPDHDPSKGGLNKQQGQHPLRERAKKLDQGILVIRFEMPFNVWCGGCSHLIGKGVRFNAEKKQIGNYHSSKIWSFSMKAPCCGQRIEVHTDPKNAEYIIASGGRQKVEAFTSEDAQTIGLMDDEERARLNDPLARLEHTEHAKAVAREEAVRMSDLRTDSDARWKDDYAANKGLRRRLRAVRKADNARDEQRKQLGLPDAVKLLPLAPEDSAAAARIKFDKSGSFERNWKRHRQAIQAQPIFAAAAPQKQMTAQAAELARAVARGTAAKRKKSVSELAAQAAKRQRL